MNDDLNRFYGFTRPPVGLISDPSRLFRAGSRQRLIDGIVADVRAGRTVMTIRGDRGVGKTCLLTVLAAALRRRRLAAVRVAGALQTPRKVQHLIASVLGIEAADTAEPGELLRASQNEPGIKGIVLLVDDAEALSHAMFRYLWLLVGLFQAGTTKLYVVLFGGLDRWPGLEHADLAPLRKAAGARIVIMPLEEDEAAAYLDHKLRCAGRPLRRIMTGEALAGLLEEAYGVPARLDALTECALVLGFQKGRRQITLATLREALFNDTPGDMPGDALPDEPRMPTPSPLLRMPWRSASAVGLAFVTVVGVVTIVDPANTPRSSERSAEIDMARSADAPTVAAAPSPVAQPLTVRQPPAIAESQFAGASATLAPVTETTPSDTRTAVSASSSVRAALINPSEDLTAGAGSTDPVPAQPDLPAEPPVTAALPVLRVAPTTTGTKTSPDIAAAGPIDEVPSDPRPPVQDAANATAGLSVTTPPTGEPMPSPPIPPVQSPETPTLHALQAIEPELIRPDVGSSLRTLHGGPGLVLMAGAGDTMPALYAQVYRGVTPPPYADVVAINPEPVKQGAIVVFPAPPGGWTPH